VKRLFGTDGIRGTAGVFPLDEPTIGRVGEALARILLGRSKRPRVLIGRDTRESGAWIEESLARSVLDAGGEPVAAGVIPTAAVAYITASSGFDAGIMISASHNPFNDNGIKIFSRDGFKLADREEARIEAAVIEGETEPFPPDPAAGGGVRSRAGGLRVEEGVADSYRDHVIAVAGGVRLAGMTVVLDCANGASYRTAPEVFRALGARVHAISDTPDGTNINSGCGSLSPEALCREVLERQADLGFAFDGDADRCILSDERGAVCDGDFVLWRSALALRAEGRLPGDTVVGTVMSNLWLERALSGKGIRLLRAPVGDKYVLEEMVRSGARLGGEQSGHVIFMDHATTGDGIITAVMMAAIVRRASVRLSEWRSQVRPCPQVLMNVRVGSRPDLGSHPVIGPAAESVRRQLGVAGRLLLRYSGTEPLVRVMIEGEDPEVVARLARGLAGVIESEIGER